ncbi:MAG TPA: glycosyltransferase family 2 protein [Patescibacteria group bacterium]|nr:glycosyltransferase family 2 protein [Patescibacteria group bacterium]
MKNPTVSIIILNYNGRKRLEICLKSLKQITFKNKEIIVVNNGSTDDSAIFLKKNYPQIKVVEIRKNRGFAGGTNTGVRYAKGKYVLLLNNDTKVTPHFLETLVSDMEKDITLGAVQPQIRSMIYPKLLDSVGSFFTSTGFLYHFGYYKPYKNKLYNSPLYAYSIKGACVLMRKKEYMILGGMDEDFVCYVEETDLCHRIWLSGKKVLYEPKSYIYHWGGGDMQVMTKDYVTMYRSFKNRILSYIKNLSFYELIKILPMTILFSEGFVLLTIASGSMQRALGAQTGVLVALLQLPMTIKKRQYIQKKIRKVSDSVIMPYIKRDPRFSYYISFFRKPESFRD